MNRIDFHKAIDGLFEIYPLVALLGPRQSGKTTLARGYGQGSGQTTHFDLENDTDLASLENPLLTLGGLKGLVVIDEVQRRPELFATLRVLADRKPQPAKFLILGSASRDLIRQGSESLAGRIGFLELTPFSLSETGSAQAQKLWIRGGFPKSFLAKTPEASRQWRRDYLATFFERDIPGLGFKIPPAQLRRFWMMLGHYHGRIFNASEIGKSLQLSDDTIRRYLDILTGTLMIRRLGPWHENLSKRQVKSPKIYFRDSGLFHALLGVWSEKDIRLHPQLGFSWEGWAIEEILRAEKPESGEIFFWATHNDAELDLLIVRDGKRKGYEVKYTDSPRLTASMRIALQDLRLDGIKVVYPGEKTFPLAENVEAVPLPSLVASLR